MELTQVPRAREDSPETYGGSSAKIDQLIQLLKLIPSDEKCLVFSQFTSFLDKVVEAFEAEGYVMLPSSCVGVAQKWKQNCLRSVRWENVRQTQAGSH